MSEAVGLEREVDAEARAFAEIAFRGTSRPGAVLHHRRKFEIAAALNYFAFDSRWN
jgi:hypothetical protein